MPWMQEFNKLIKPEFINSGFFLQKVLQNKNNMLILIYSECILTNPVKSTVFHDQEELSLERDNKNYYIIW